MLVALAIGSEVVVNRCTHYDVKSGTPGVVTGIMTNCAFAGYAVEVTCPFALDVQACQMRTETQTVFVEADGLTKKSHS